MTNEPQSDRQSGDGLRKPLEQLLAAFKGLMPFPLVVQAVAEGFVRDAETALAFSPARDAAEGATQVAAEDDGGGNENYLFRKPAPPKPAPDAMREALEQIEAMKVGHAATIAREVLKLVKAAAPVPPADGALESDIKLIGSALSKGDHPGGVTQAFYRVAAALRSPSPAVAAEPVAWQNIDKIIDALEAAGCCRNGQVSSSEDHIANTIRDWLRSLATPPVRGGREAFYSILINYIPQETIDQAWQELCKAGLVP